MKVLKRIKNSANMYAPIATWSHLQKHTNSHSFTGSAARLTCRHRASPLLLQRLHYLHWDVILKGGRGGGCHFPDGTHDQSKTEMPVSSALTGSEYSRMAMKRTTMMRMMSPMKRHLNLRHTMNFMVLQGLVNQKKEVSGRLKVEEKKNWPQDHNFFLKILEILQFLKRIHTLEGPVLGSCWVRPCLFLQVSRPLAFHLQSPVSSPLFPLVVKI